MLQKSSLRSQLSCTASEGRLAIDMYVLSFSKRGKMVWDSPLLSGPVGMCTGEEPSQATSS